MNDDIAGLVERLEAGLEGVWRGQWAAGVVTDGDGREVPHDGYVSDIDGEGLDIEIKTYDDRAQKVARHIANCDPDTIRALLSALKAQAAEIERLTKERYEWQVAAGRMAVDGAISEAKLREAVDVMREADAELYEINMSNYDHDEVTRLNQGSINAAIAIRAFLATMEKQP